MGKTVKFIVVSVLFFGMGTIIFGKYLRNRIPLQEKVTADLNVRGSYLKIKYVIRFSTEEKKGNFKILSKEEDVEI